MTCPRCGAGNREGASYCDSCGEALIAHVEPRTGSGPQHGSSGTVLGSPGLVGWMALDWFLRFAALGVIGFVAGIATLSMGIYDFSVFFFLLSAIGIVGTWYMLKAE